MTTNLKSALSVFTRLFGLLALVVGIAIQSQAFLSDMPVEEDPGFPCETYEEGCDRDSRGGPDDVTGEDERDDNEEEGGEPWS